MKTAQIIPFRRDILPENLFKMIEGYMHGDIMAIHIIAVTKDERVINASAGDIPVFIKENDVKYGI